MEESQAQTAIPAEDNTSNYLYRVEQLQTSAPGCLKLPVTEAAPVAADADTTARDIYQLQLDLITSLLTAANNKNDNVIADLITNGLVSPNAHSPEGQTALLAAVRAGSVSTVRGLVALGASVDLPGRALVASAPANRTPLQLACMLGNMTIVKIMIEEYHANDSWMAPDGALARQLAQENGHRDIVAYLSGQREAPEQAREMNNAIRVPLAIIVMFVYIIPRRLFYELPIALWQARHRQKSNGTPGERGHGICQVLLEIPFLLLVMVYEIPRQAIIWIKKKLKGSKKSNGGSGDQV